MKAIQTHDLTKRFDDVDALKGLDLSVDKGELYGFIGPNGAGKTTTINVLTGQLNPTSGTSSVLGIDPVLAPVDVRSKVGILPEREDPPSFMTPREYFEFVAEVRDIDGIERRIAVWAERLKFEEKLDSLNKDLSKGEKQKVMITQAFLHEPELVFIDEPLINLDPIIQERVKDFFQEYRDDGNTLFLSTHVLSLAEDICTRVGIIDQGELVAEMDRDEFEDQRLIEIFLTEVERFESPSTDA
ncbi:MAG: ABC transporter ATP-binding protein [Candidatus Nanohaloarchaea archaeon]|nr:ABC transporter ATP-binding protein [Candidatus Nanohaloarchaea archaeon]